MMFELDRNSGDDLVASNAQILKVFKLTEQVCYIFLRRRCTVHSQVVCDQGLWHQTEDEFFPS